MPQKSKADEYQDKTKVHTWLLEQRGHVLSYLDQQGLQVNGLPVPEWDLAPYVAVWSFPTGWVISGDLPTDYLVDENITSPREAMRGFSQRFADLAKCMLDGRSHSQITIGDPADTEQQKELGRLLASRAETLGQFAENDNLWPEQLAEWQDRLDDPDYQDDSASE